MKTTRIFASLSIFVLAYAIHAEPAIAGNSLDAADGNPVKVVYVDNDGNVGIGTQSPARKLHVHSESGQAIARIEGTSDGINAGILEIADANSGDIWQIPIRTEHNQNLEFYVWDSLMTAWRGPHLAIQKDGNVGIGTANPMYELDVVGATATDILVIKGGADIAEPFLISGREKTPKGSLVVIDDKNPGHLKLSCGAYDSCVAGVVSGAGGLNPGLTLTQKGKVEGGVNVALTGRVYALADTSNGPIKPGDMLTTSNIPGHAMKATDRNRAFGAVIGKAMSPLKKGRGLVLVLVSLQ